MPMSAPLGLFSACLLMLAASTGALAQGDPAAQPQHPVVERILLGHMVAQGDTMAEEMTCAKDDGTHCILAKDANGDEVEVLVFAVKAGEKLTCTEKRDHIQCQKDPRQLQHDAMQKP